MQFMLVTHLVLVSVWGSAVQGGWFDLPLHIHQDTGNHI